MGIVQYFENELGKRYNITAALAAGGWPNPPNPGLKLIDRKDPSEVATVKRYNSVSGGIGCATVDFEGGGWLCLDHAIEQYQPVER